jgi:hypothetical protein
VARFILSHAVVSECPLSAFLISFFKKSRFRFEAKAPVKGLTGYGEVLNQFNREAPPISATALR